MLSLNDLINEKKPYEYLEDKYPKLNLEIKSSALYFSSLICLRLIHQ